jgi:putative membrane protein
LAGWELEVRVVAWWPRTTTEHLEEEPAMMWGWHGWSWWGWLLMTASMVAFWGLIIWGIVAIFRGFGGSWRRPEGRDPEQILAERYANGEIDEEEYHRRLQTLRSARYGVGEPQR